MKIKLKIYYIYILLNMHERVCIIINFPFPPLPSLHPLLLLLSLEPSPPPSPSPPSPFALSSFTLLFSPQPLLTLLPHLLLRAFFSSPNLLLPLLSPSPPSLTLFSSLLSHLHPLLLTLTLSSPHPLMISPP